MKKAYSPGKLSDIKITNMLKNNKDLKNGTSLSKYISSQATNRNNKSKYTFKERPSSHKTINSLVSKKSKPHIQKKHYQYQPINIKNNNNEINIHLSFGSDSMNNNTNSYSNNTNYSKGTNSYEDILKEKDKVILKLEKKLLSNRELINKIKSQYNINNNYYMSNSNNNLISLSKTKSSGNVTTKRKTKQDTQYFFTSLLKNIYKKEKNKKKKNNNININNCNGYISNKGLSNILYNTNDNGNIFKGNYKNYCSNLNLKKKNKKKKTNSCELIDKIKCIENILFPKNNNKNKNKDKKNNLTYENWKFICDNIYNKTKNILEKCQEIINDQLLDNYNDNLINKK